LEDLKEFLHYDPSSGVIYWVKSNSNRSPKGSVAGSVSPTCVSIGFRGVLFKAHRVAWALFHGRWPEGVIDHINGNTFDNRLTNLRDITQQQNTFNSGPSKNNKCGTKGVYLRKDTSKWQAEITLNRKKISLGSHATKELAAAAYAKAATELFGGFRRTES
jgi:hypothetical protein